MEFDSVKEEIETKQKAKKTVFYFGKTNLEPGIGIKEFRKALNFHKVKEGEKNPEPKSPTNHFKLFLVKKFKIKNKKEVANEFGENCSLNIGNDLDTHKNEENGKAISLFVNLSEFQEFIKNEPLVKWNNATKSVESITSGKAYQKSTAVKIAKAVSDKKILEAVAKKTPEYAKKIIKGLSQDLGIDDIVASKNSIEESALNEIIEVGELLLSNKPLEAVKRSSKSKWGTVLSKKKTTTENAWNKYFYFYKEAIFINERNITDKLVIEADDSKEFSKATEFDMFAIDDLGRPNVIELKLASSNVFKFDRSHNILAPTKELSNSISQTYNYISSLSNLKTPEKFGFNHFTKKMGIGIIVIGSYKTIVNDSGIKKLLEEGKTEEEILKLAKESLMLLNHNLTKITIVTYDVFINKLKNLRKITNINQE